MSSCSLTHNQLLHMMAVGVDQLQVVPRLRWFRFDPRPVFVGFVMDKVAMGQGFCCSTSGPHPYFFIMPRTLYNHSTSTCREIKRFCLSLSVIIVPQKENTYRHRWLYPSSEPIPGHISRPDRTSSSSFQM